MELELELQELPFNVNVVYNFKLKVFFLMLIMNSVIPGKISLKVSLLRFFRISKKVECFSGEK